MSPGGGIAQRLQTVFDRHGPLAARIPRYRERSQQLEMADRVAGAIRDNAVLVCEAGTGTGKTFAYLVPALLSSGKVILSTGTKTLQDQLYHRDLPMVRAALNVPVTTALLKGRANYVCHYHLERNLAEGGLSSRDVVGDLQRIVSFARVTRTGDKSELADVPEEAPAWSLATSTRENCLGQSCPRFRDCFVMAARREALAADLIVVNHHLFFADVMLKDEGMAELLPACNTVIFDEAHSSRKRRRSFSANLCPRGKSLSSRGTFVRKRSLTRRTCPTRRGSLPRWTRRPGICASRCPTKARASLQCRSGESADFRMRSPRSIPRYARYARPSTCFPNAARVWRAAPSARERLRPCSNAGATTAAPIWSAGSRCSVTRFA